MLNQWVNEQNFTNTFDQSEIFRREASMAFVNEYISDEDKKKFNIDKIDKRFPMGTTHSPQWTIDRDRNIYLRCVARGREEIAHRSKWTFFWKGNLLVLELDNISTSGSAGGDRHGHKRIRKIEIPYQLENQRKEIISDLKEALISYKDGGVFSTAQKYTLTLDIV